MNPRYDVFLSHSSADKPAVEELARKLQKAGIEPFLDKWDLIPGRLWQPDLEEGLRNSRACIIFVGSEGMGPWHAQEMQLALIRGAQDPNFLVIPVLLPIFKKPADIPGFLALRTWVEFSSLDDEDAFRRLVSGIQGKAPGPGGEPAKRPLPYRCMAQPPDEWVHRREYDEVLEALCPKGGFQAGLSVGITTALRGAGGFGKTALAQKLCFDERVREKYPDGILWMTMEEDLTEAGRLSRILDLVRWWTGKEAPAFETVDGVAAALRKLLAGLRVLLVIDDAWSSLDVNPLKGLDSGSALLITTRVAHVLPDKSVSVSVDSLASSEAVALLGLGLPSNDLPPREIKELTARLGEWALLLRLVNGTLKDLVKRGLSVQEAIQRANEDLDAEGFSAFDKNDPDSRHAAAARALLVSVKYLSEADRNLFFELAIFPEDEDIPLSVLSRYWGLNLSGTRKLFGKLNDLSLLRELDPKEESIRLHDVTRKILQEQRAEALSGLHGRLLEAFRPKSGQWEDLPFGESYLWHRLRDHFIGAERQPEFKVLLKSFSFIEAKLMATDVNSLIADFETFAAENLELRLIRDALRLSAHILGRDRAQVSSQLYGRLLGRHELALRVLVESARSSCQGTGLWPKTAALTQPGSALIHTLEGHTYGVNAVALVDGRCAISASSDGTLRVWDLDSGQTLKTLEGHTRAVNAVAVVDGRRAISASSDRTLRLWDLDSAQILKTLKEHTAEVTAVAVVDIRRAVSGNINGTLRVWDLRSGRALKTLEGHTRWVAAVAVVDGRRAISASYDRTLRVWDLESGKTLKTLKGHTAGVTAVAVVDGRRAVSASYDGMLRVWDLESGRTLKTLEGHTDCVRAVAVVDGRRAVSASDDGTLREWDLESGRTLGVTLKVFGLADRVNVIAVVDGRRAVSGNRNGTLRVWDLESERTLKTLEGHTDWVTAVAVVDGWRAVSGSRDGSLWVWDLESGKTLKTLEGHTGWVTAVAVFDGRYAVSASHDRTLRVWDLESGQTLKTLEGHTDWVTAVVAVDGRRAISGSGDGTLRVWDLESGTTLKTLKGHGAGVLALAVVDDRGAVSASDSTLNVWDLESGKILKTLRGHRYMVRAVSVMEDRRAVSASDDGTLRVWDLESGKTLKTLDGHTGWVTAVAVLDGRCAISASNDRTLRVWDLENGEVLAMMTLDALVSAIAATPDGKIIVAGDSIGKVHFFDLTGLKARDYSAQGTALGSDG